MTHKADSKNPRLSIHGKYKRRLNRLAFVLADFIDHTEAKLDESVAGKIYNRDKIENIVARARELAKLLPDVSSLGGDGAAIGDISVVLEQAAANTSRSLGEGEAFLKSLKPGELE